MVEIPTMSRNTENATGLEDEMSSVAVRYNSMRLKGVVRTEDTDQEVLS